MKTTLELIAKSRLYRVECWEAPIEGDDRFKYSRFGLHQQIGVVCHSAVEAIDLVRGLHPTYRIDAVNQVGFVNHVAESAVNGSAEQI